MFGQRKGIDHAQRNADTAIQERTHLYNSAGRDRLDDRTHTPNYKASHISDGFGIPADITQLRLGAVHTAAGHRQVGRLSRTLITAGGLCAMALPVVAATPTAWIFCPTCADIPSMTNYANNWGRSYGWPVGAVFGVTSENMPITAFFKWELVRVGPTYLHTAIPQTTTFMAAAALDNRLFARAAKALGFNDTRSYTSSDAAIMADINAALIVQNGAGNTGPWHGVQGEPDTPYWDFKSQGGWFSDPKTYTFYQYDYITVHDPNGYSQNWVLTGMQLVNGRWIPQWSRVAGSLMYKGKPVTPPTSSNATPIIAPVTGYTTWTSPNGTLNITLDQYLCYGWAGGVIYSPDGSYQASGGYLPLPC